MYKRRASDDGEGAMQKGLLPSREEAVAAASVAVRSVKSMQVAYHLKTICIREHILGLYTVWQVHASHTHLPLPCCMCHIRALALKSQQEALSMLQQAPDLNPLLTYALSADPAAVCAC